MCAKQISKKDSAPTQLVSTPYRAREIKEPGSVWKNFFSSLSSKFPLLKADLEMAEIDAAPYDFVRSAFVSSAIVSLMLELLVAWALVSQRVSALSLALMLIIAFPIFFFLSFNASLQQPKLKMAKRAKEIDQEIVFCGRHLLIELRSGVTLFDAMLGVTRDYGEISKEFNKIVEKITLGVPATVAMHDVAEKCPSHYFKRMIMQIANSLTSGSDVADSLDAVLEQVSREQIIKLKEYGQKLNPLVMFYMLFGIIIPSLGVAFMVIVFSVLGSGFSQMGITLLGSTVIFVLLIQGLFITIAENSRPNFDL